MPMGAVSKVRLVKMQIRVIQKLSFYLKTGLFWDLLEIFFRGIMRLECANCILLFHAS